MVIITLFQLKKERKYHDCELVLMDFPVKGFYDGRPIRAMLDGTNVVRVYEFVDKPGVWYAPLIENEENVEKDKFQLNIEQMTLF